MLPLSRATVWFVALFVVPLHKHKALLRNLVPVRGLHRESVINMFKRIRNSSILSFGSIAVINGSGLRIKDHVFEERPKTDRLIDSVAHPQRSG